MYPKRQELRHGSRPSNPDRLCCGTCFHHETATRLGNRLESEVFVEAVGTVVDGINDDHPAATDSDCLKGGSERLHKKPSSAAPTLRRLGHSKASEEKPGDHIGAASGDGAR